MVISLFNVMGYIANRKCNMDTTRSSNYQKTKQQQHYIHNQMEIKNVMYTLKHIVSTCQQSVADFDNNF